MVLSERLQTIADMIPSGARVADVGCDHGFLDVYLVQTGKIPGALAMDVRQGPLAAAKRHVEEAQLAERISTRLSDGLEAFHVGEAKTLVCAGMGGPLMQRILTAYPEKTESFQDFLLQPQSEIREFRAFLRENGYRIVEERIVLEDGKYYFPMRVQWATEGLKKEPFDGAWEVFDRYGEGLLRKREPLFLQYLQWQRKVYEAILRKLTALGEDERAKRRISEVKLELEMLSKAFELTK